MKSFLGLLFLGGLLFGALGGFAGMSDLNTLSKTPAIVALPSLILDTVAFGFGCVICAVTGGFIALIQEADKKDTSRLPLVGEAPSLGFRSS